MVLGVQKCVSGLENGLKRKIALKKDTCKTVKNTNRKEHKIV